MVRVEIIRKRLYKLDEYLRILKRLKDHSFEDFDSQPEIYGSAERFLQLAVESLIDIGNHLISDQHLGQVNWYSDIPNILHNNGHIDASLKSEFIKMIGFRNTLVHDYMEIDRKIVYDVLQNRLDVIRALGEKFAEFL